MIVTVANLITDAMGLCGTVAIDETPTTSELALGLRTLNIMIDRWSSQNLLLRSTTAVTFNTVAGKVSYTGGISGADLAVAKLLDIRSGYVTDGSTDFDLEVWTRQMYNTLADKTLSTARPSYVAYDPGAAQQAVPVGTIYLYPSPDKVYSVALEASAYLTDFATTGETVTFEPAYYEALIYCLAARLFRHYNGARFPLPIDIARIAHDALTNLKSMNSVRVPAAMDLEGSKGVYDATTDSYN